MLLDQVFLDDRLPRVVVKIRSANTEAHATRASSAPPFNFRSRSSTHICSLTTRRLRSRFVFEKVHCPSFFCRARTTLMVPRSQSMSRQQRARYSLGRIPVVRATAKRHVCDECDAALRNDRACSVVSTDISLPCSRGSSTPCVGSLRSNCQRIACLIAARKTACAYRTVRAGSSRSIMT